MPYVTKLEAGSKFLWTSRLFAFVSVVAAVKTVYSPLQNDCPDPQCLYPLPPLAGQCHMQTHCSLQGRHCSESDNAAWLRFAANRLPMVQLPTSTILLLQIGLITLHSNAHDLWSSILEPILAVFKLSKCQANAKPEQLLSCSAELSVLNLSASDYTYMQ